MDNNPATTPNISSNNMQPTTPQNSIQIDSLAPNGRPMKQAVPTAETPQPKKKIGLIILIITTISVLAIGGIAAAVIIANLNQKDRATVAIEKIMRGEAPSNVAIDGDIKIDINNKFSPISSININLNSGIIPSSFTNNSVAKVTTSVRGIGDFTVEFDEIYATDGDLYFKIDGITSALEDSRLLYLLNLTSKLPSTVNCGDDKHCQAEELNALICKNGGSCDSVTVQEDAESITLDGGGQAALGEDTLSYVISMLDAVELIDGEWLRITTDELGSIMNGSAETSEANCIVDLVNTVSANNYSAIELYNRYPFISSSDENIEITSRDYPVYKLSLDSTAFSSYVNSIRNSAISDKIYSCFNLERSVWMDEEDIAAIAKDLPVIYAEINDNDNFSRLYVTSDINNGDATVTMDLNISYPPVVNVPEPLEYRDYSDVIQEISTGIYDTNIDNNH